MTIYMHKEKRRNERDSFTEKVGVSGSKPEPAEAKLTPVISSLLLSFGSKYGGNNSSKPTYEAVQCPKVYYCVSIIYLCLNIR